MHQFARRYETTLGRGGTPNMHAVQHLADVVEDYGPAHAWTCFPFERFNGITEDTGVNSHNIEETLMRAWTEQDHLRILPHLTGEWAKLGVDLRALYGRLHAAKKAGPPPVSITTDEDKKAHAQWLDVGAQFATVTLERMRRAAAEEKEARVAAAEEKKAGGAPVAAEEKTVVGAPWVCLIPGPARRKKSEMKIGAELVPVVRAHFGVAGPSAR